MKSVNTSSALALILLSLSAHAHASDMTMETVVVKAAREPIALSEVASSVTLLDRETLSRRQSAPLSEILRSVPGVAVSRAGVMGAQTQVRLRGGEANHVLVFIDGVKANDPSLGDEFNFAHLLNYNLESVQVIRGPQSALWGSDAVSGVINITTRSAGEGLKAEAYAEGGSNSWQNYGGSLGWADERLNLRLGVTSMETDGENISRQGNEDDGYENQTYNLAAGYEISDALSSQLSLRYTDADNDFDGTDYVNTGLPYDTDDKTESDQLYGRFALNLETLDGRWTHQLSYAVTDTSNDNTTENAFAPTGFDNTSTDADVSLITYQSGFRVIEGHWLTIALEHQESDYKQRGPIDFFGDPNRDENMETDSATIEYRAALGENVSLLASARHDDNSDFDDSTTGRVSVAWRLADGNTKLRAAYGTGTKNPTFTERFGYFNDFVGNPDLQPEDSTGWEAGVDQRLLDGSMNLSLTWFDEELDDEINGFSFDPSLGEFGAYTAINENGTSKRQGLEFNGNWMLMASLSLNVSYTWLDATQEDSVTGQDSDEVRRPRHIGSAGIDWRFADDRANLNVNVDYNGEQDDLFFSPIDPYPTETVELDDFTLLTVAGSYQISEQLQVFARVENALDEDYEELLGYVSPGRTAYAGIRYRFSR